MRITPVSNFKINQTRVNNLNKFNNSFTSNIQNTPDVFIKSAPLALKALDFEKTYQVLEEKVMEYVFTAQEFKVEEIQEIIDEFCPEVEVVDAQDFETAFSNECGNMYHQEIYISHKDSKLFYTCEKERLSLSFLDADSLEKRLLFGIFMLHEIVHMLQQKSSDHTSKAKLMSEVIKNCSDIEEVFKAHQLMHRGFANLEDLTYRILQDIFANYDYGYHELDEEKSDETSKKILREDMDYFAKSLLTTYISLSRGIPKAISYDGLLDFVILELGDEIEAYKKSCDSICQYTNIDNILDGGAGMFYKARIILYQKILDAAKKEKEQKEFEFMVKK